MCRRCLPTASPVSKATCGHSRRADPRPDHRGFRAMLIIPAIDLQHGACVRLRQGRMEDATVFSDDPESMAAQWVEGGCRRLHLVDRNGAFEGKPVNGAAVTAIARRPDHRGFRARLIIPAIDLKDGACVRLRQGRMEDATVFSDDPVSMAAKWVEGGCRRPHLVDLNGAFEGKPVNGEVVTAIARR